MAEHIYITGNTRTEKYAELLPQIEALVTGENNLTANLANIAAALKEAFGFFWVGFYLTDSESELVLGPFQGPIACTRIALGKGVCGTVFEQKKALLVPNVDEFPGHIACSAASKSEVVVPILLDEKVLGVIDVDSDKLDDFTEVDLEYLAQIADLVTSLMTKWKS